MSKQIMACIDGSQSSTAVCHWASWASKKLQCPITLLHVLDNATKVNLTNFTGNIGLGSRENLLEELAALDAQRSKLALQHGKHLLEDALHSVVENGIKEAHCLQRHGSLVETLQGLEQQIKLLVIGRQGEETAASTSQIGSQLETTIRTLHCPILVALPNFHPPKQVMFAFDASPTANEVLQYLIENAHLLQGLTCHLVMVNKSSQQAELPAAQSRLTEVGVDVVTALLEGQVESVLGDYIEKQAIDLLIMGAYGHTRIRQFFVGSTTNHMLHATKIPLLLVR
jgi:nucleotide-binding universal stress UspA family protein